MAWNVEYTDELEDWWLKLTEPEQESVNASVGLLEALGSALGFPHSSSIEGSRHGHMRELRFSTRDDLLACCTPLICAGQRFRCSMSTKQVMIDGTWCMSRLRIGSAANS